MQDCCSNRVFFSGAIAENVSSELLNQKTVCIRPDYSICTVPNFEDYREMILKLSDSHLVTVNSLKNTMKSDAEVADEEVTPLTWKTKLKRQMAEKNSPTSKA